MTARAGAPQPDQVIADLWSNLTRAPRLALCALVYIDTDYTRTPWESIPVVDRKRLVGAMHVMSSIALDCARALERASSHA